MSIYNNYLLTSFIPWNQYCYVLAEEDLTDYMRMTKRLVMFVTLSAKRNTANAVNQFITRMISQP